MPAEPRQYRVLLIDPDPQRRSAHSEGLAGLGYQVTAHTHGLAGLEAYFERHFDPRERFHAVITAYHMPEFGGLDVLENVARTSTGTPVLICDPEPPAPQMLATFRRGAADWVVPSEGVEGLHQSLERAAARQSESMHHLQLAPAPCERLRELLAERQQGELIVRHQDVEVHVYISDGRVIWATTSTSRRPFTHFLIKEHGISPEEIRRGVALCRRIKGKVGETLVAMDIASVAQVGDALRRQLRVAIADLHRIEQGEYVFLKRDTHFSKLFSFELDELVPERG